MRRVILFVLLAITTPAATLPACAQFMNYTPLEELQVCNDDKIYSADAPDAPVAIRDGLQAKPGATGLRTCTDEGERIHYFLRRASLQHDSLCRLDETEIFRGDDAERLTLAAGTDNPSVTLKGWKLQAPPQWTRIGYHSRIANLGLLSEGSACPPASDPRYIFIRNISDHATVAFLNAWKNITGSPASFDKAFANIPFEFGIYIPWKRVGAEALRARWRDEIFRGNAKLTSISCNENHCRVVTGLLGIRNSRWVEFTVGPAGIVLIKMGAFLTA